MQRKIAPLQTEELKERPIPEVMRAEENTKTQLSTKMARMSRRPGDAVKRMDEWVAGLRRSKGTDHQRGGQQFSLPCKMQGQKHLEIYKEINIKTRRTRRRVARATTDREG